MLNSRHARTILSAISPRLAIKRRRITARPSSWVLGPSLVLVLRAHQGPRTKDGPGTKDQGPRTKDKGQRTKDKGQRTKDKGPATVIDSKTVFVSAGTRAALPDPPSTRVSA